MNLLRPALALIAICWGATLLAAELGASTVIIPNAHVTLRNPRAMSVSGDGILHIADTGNHRVISLDSNGAIVAEIGGFGSGNGQFQWPDDIKADRGSSVWVVDSGNRRIQRLSRLLEFQGAFQLPVELGETYPQPSCLAVAPGGDLYVADRDNGSILRFDPLFNQLSSHVGGQEFLRPILSLCFVSGTGLIWSDADHTLIQADPLLNHVSYVSALPKSTAKSVSAMDSNLIVVSPDRVRAINPASGRLLWSADSTIIATTGLAHVDVAVWSRLGKIYLLDSKQGKIARMDFAESE